MVQVTFDRGLLVGAPLGQRPQPSSDRGQVSGPQERPDSTTSRTISKSGLCLPLKINQTMTHTEPGPPTKARLKEVPVAELIAWDKDGVLQLAARPEDLPEIDLLSGDHPGTDEEL